MKNILVKYFDGATKIGKISKGDWIDLYARETVIIPQGQSARVKLGVAMKLPEGYEAHLAARSSTFSKWGCILTNAMGIIDNSYSGDNDEWMAQMYCLEKKGTINGIDATIINKGDKICQFRIMENQPELEIVEVEKLDGPDRGGFGSTGSR